VRPLGKNDPTYVSTYRLLGVLGGGGMGRVYLGQSRTGRRLAIKMLSEQFAEDPEYRERFAREITAAKLVSPLYTAAVVDADPHAKNPWLATTFIDGPSLEEWVTRHGALPADKVLALAAGLAEALISIHDVGLVHRDLKPSNVIINPNGPHIIDFGIALGSEDTRITTSLMVGTPSYMAPERINGLDAGPAGDIFSLGATLYYAATASSLVTGGSFYEQIIQVALGQFDLTALPKECRSVIELCLSQAPQDRPTADELMRVLIGMGVQQPETGWWPELEVKSVTALVPRPSRRRILVGASASGVLLIGAGVSALAYRLRPQGAPPLGPASPGAASREPVESSPQATGVPDLPERVVALFASGAAGKPPGTQGSAARIIVYQGRHVITSAGSTVLATGFKQERLWSKNLPTSAVRLWQWGDAVLAADQRTLWMFDAQSGAQRFATELAAIEERNHAGDNPDRMTVQIDRIVTGEDRAMVELGTATVALNRTGQSMWRVARGFDDNRRRTPPPMPFLIGGGLVVSRESGPGARITARMAGNGRIVWQQPDTFSPRQPPPPPNGPGGEGDEAWQRKEGRVLGEVILLRDGSEVQVRALNRGRVIWNHTSQTPIAWVEAAFGVVVIAADRLVARRLTDGTVAWEQPMRGARVAVAGDSLVVMHDDGVALLDNQGRVVWEERYPDQVRESMMDKVVVHEKTAFALFRPKGGGPGGPGGLSGGPGGLSGGPGAPPPGGRAAADVVAYRLS
jgi:tRNA A-37 threonylcarbamoyl transferase component Bud32